MPARVDREKCDACTGRSRRECAFNCPYDAIPLMDGRAWVDPARCDDCKICVEVCPVKAISHR